MNRRLLRFVGARRAGALLSTVRTESPQFGKERVGEKPFDHVALDQDALDGDEELTLRDEAIFLLHTAAEVEHSLMVQYLYAAFSLERSRAKMSGSSIPQDAETLTKEWFEAVFQIAKEEMGHLITVQNVLRLIGGPLNFDREDFPFRTALYPYPFELEPLTKTSLAKYIAAEMPATPPVGKEAVVADVLRRLNLDRLAVNRVGALYARIIAIVEQLDADADFDRGSVDLQGSVDEWIRDSVNVLVRPCQNQTVAIRALQAIADQGEGPDNVSGDLGSHFDRFVTVYERFPDDDAVSVQKWRPTRLVTRNPNTTSGTPPGMLSDDEREFEREKAGGRIANPVSMLWAKLFNIRYRMLLTTICHSLMIRRSADAPRDVMVEWAFNEMTGIGRLLDWLSTLPKASGGVEGETAGAPFELPYTLSVPDRERDRWRLHAELIRASDRIVEAIRNGPNPDDPLGILNLIQSGNDSQSRRELIRAQIGRDRPCDGSAEQPPVE